MSAFYSPRATYTSSPGVPKEKRGRALCFLQASPPKYIYQGVSRSGVMQRYRGPAVVAEARYFSRISSITTAR